MMIGTAETDSSTAQTALCMLINELRAMSV